MLMHPHRRHRAGALVVVLAGGSAGLIGLGRHLDNTGPQAWQHQAADIGGAILLVAAIALLVLTAMRAGRR